MFSKLWKRPKLFVVLLVFVGISALSAKPVLAFMSWPGIPVNKYTTSAANGPGITYSCDPNIHGPNCGRFCNGGICSTHSSPGVLVVKLTCTGKSTHCVGSDHRKIGEEQSNSTMVISDVPCGTTSQYDVVDTRYAHDPSNPSLHLLDFVSFYGGDCPANPPPPSGVPTPPPTVPVCPGVARNLSTSSISCNASSVTLYWGAVPNAGYYDVRVDGSGASGPRKDCSPHSVCVNGYSANSMTVNVIPGQSYSFWVHSSAPQCPASPTSEVYNFYVPVCSVPQPVPQPNPQPEPVPVQPRPAPAPQPIIVYPPAPPVFAPQPIPQTQMIYQTDINVINNNTNTNSSSSSSASSSVSEGSVLRVE